MINYKKGGKEVKLEDSKVVVDPRSQTSFRGKSHLSVGNTNPVRKGKAARPQKPVTWY